MKSHASMNRIYRLVFNAALGIWVAVAENAKGRGKGGRAASALLAVLAVLSPAAHAASAADATRTGGAGTVTTVGNTTTINQTSQRLALDWTQLSTVAGEALSFVQPNAQAIALNRITGASPSSFLGSLTANGQVFILNPNGILFGAGSQVNVGGIVASTLGMNPTDFMNGSNTFTRTSGRGSVVNQGSMTAAQGGYLAMLAPEVRNEGVMTASLGTALLAAGNKVTLNLDNGSLLGYSIDQGAINALAENKQLIKADGGQVLLSAKALDALTTATVNNTGVIEARTLQNIAGRIMLMGDMEHGTVNVGGTLDASAPTGGNGGFIETSAAHVKVATGTRVTTLAASGQTGKWLIDPNDFTIAATGGDMDATTVVGNLATTNFEIQTATMGSAGLGDIHVNEALTWTSANTLTLTAQRNININQAITATNGGLTLNSTSNGLISAPAAVNVGTFDLVNGKWEQLSGSLPAFSATDFRISGGTFIRALGGDGLSAVTAYQLTDVYGLQGAGSDGMLNKHYKLANDIDATGTALWNGGVGGAGFKPIGDGANNYTGTFDGDSKTISNLTINRPAEYSVGLIGHLGGSGTVMNVGLTNVSATGDTHVGGLAGANDGQISNSYVTGSVTGNYNVGGLVGNNNFGAVSDSYATGAVTGLDSVGGLIGSNNYGAISNSYASGAVTSIELGGGLVGINAGTISDSYATGSVTGTSFLGGLVGAYFSGTIINSYATGSVTGTSFLGGLVGFNIGGTVSNSFWNINTTGQATSGGGTGMTTAQMKQASTFTNWSIATTGGSSNVWRIYEGNTGPLLRSYLTAFNLTPSFDGSVNNPANIGAYTVPGGANPTKLLGAAAAASDKLTLSNTGTAGEYTATVAAGRYSHQQGYDLVTHRVITTAGSAAGDVQLGNDISFTNGTLAVSAANNINLNGKAITTGSGTLQINGGTAINAGAVNVDTFNLAGGTWQQVGGTPAAFAVRDFGISGGTFIRALGGDGLSAGTAYQLTDVYGLQGAGSAGMLNKNYKLANNIDASGTALWNGGVGGAGFDPIGDNTTRFTGTFDGNNKTVSNLTINRPGQDYVGLMGDLGTGGTVTNVGLVNVSVDGLFYVGGIAGNSGGTISNSYATGRVEGQGEAGGLVGVNSVAGQISNSYVTSSVSGYSYVGGLVGTNSGTISESYATGSVTGNDRVGGLVGTNWGAGQISNSYATGSVSGNDYVGGLVSINDATISNSYATGSVGGIGHVGGLVGINYETISNSFWNTQTSGQTTSAGGTGMTTVEMMQAATFTSAGWSASNVGGDGTTWRIYEGNSGPLLRGLMTGLTLANTTVTYNGGTQQGATTADARVLGGSNASGRNFGSYANSYYSNQQGVDIIGGSLAVNKANLVLSTSNVTKTYDGDRSALGTAIVTASTALLGGDTATGGSFAFINKNAGTGNKAVSTTGVNVNDGNSGNNYSVSYANNTTSTITPKALTVLGMTAGNKVYDRTDSATVNTGSASYSGLVSGDLLAVNATGTFTDKNVANGKTVSLTSSYTGADVNNYIITSQATTTANITPKALTVSGITAANKIYDQGMSATVSTTGAVLGGFIAGDVLAVNATGVFLDKNAATGKTVNLTSSYTGADVGNYTITDQSTTVASITPKVLTVSGVTASNKTYDQTTAATVSTAGAVLGGLIAGDVLAVNATGMFTDKNAATLKTVNLTSNYTGADAGNYAITNQASTTANITPKSLTVSGATAQNKVYDATTAATITFSDNRIAGDVLGFTSAANFSDKNVGTAKTVNYSGVAATGVDAGNYTLSATSGVSSANITRAPLNITANNDGRLAGAPYSGGNGVVYSGLVGGETASVLTGALAFSGNSQGASTAGSYAITPGGQAGSNYAIAFNNGVLTLTPAPVPAPAAPVSAIANALRKFTPDIAGFDPEESFSAAKNSVQTSFKVDGGSGGSGGGSGGSGGGAGGANTPEGKLNAAANGDAGDAADEN